MFKLTFYYIETDSSMAVQGGAGIIYTLRFYEIER